MPAKGGITILDFGAQYSQLIARRIRHHNIYAEVVPYWKSIEYIQRSAPKGIVLSGGPASACIEKAPLPDPAIFDANIPILGICYGMQVTTQLLGGKVAQAQKKEFGKAHLHLDRADLLYKNIPDGSQVWMSHADHITKMPKGFQQLAHTDSSIASMADLKRRIYTVQFHPEVTHSVYGQAILKNFAVEICGCKPNWGMGDFIEQSVSAIREKVGDKKVILGLSGGVDSSVTAVLIHRAIGSRLTCLFVDTGLLRKGEAQKVMQTYGAHFEMDIRLVAAQEQFLKELAGVASPEQKRKIIGQTFIAVFDKESKKIKNVDFLAQGTIYPDVIESQSIRGPSDTIKSHHNVGGLPESMNLRLIEPLRELFKDEVREVGKKLSIPMEMIDRHPFPGPGLGIRILGEVSAKKIAILQEADAIFIEEMRKAKLYQQVSQAFVVLLPVKSVGVMGDVRTYEYTAVIRSVDTTDFMTATWSHLPHDLLERVGNRIINEVSGVNRVAYDISSKPPATIEWE